MAKKLSPQRRAVLDLLVQGKSNKDIARRLGVTQSTVGSTTSAIYEVLGVSNRVEATLAGLRKGVNG